MASSSIPPSEKTPALVPRGAFEGKPAIKINRPVWIIGSRQGCHLHLQSQNVSQAHAVIINTGRGVFIKDLASRSHTYVNKRKISEALLVEGDKIQIGNFKFRFADPTATPGQAPLMAEPASLRISDQSMQIALSSRATLIGRRPTCDIPMEEEAVSTTHALVFDLDGDHYVRDLGTRTGTYVNDKKIHQELLHFGDVIRIGHTTFVYDEAPADLAHEAHTEPRAEISDAPADVEDEGISLAPAARETVRPAVPELAPDLPTFDAPIPMVEEPQETPAAEAEISLAGDVDELEVSATATPIVERPAADEIGLEDDEPQTIQLDELEEIAPNDLEPIAIDDGTPEVAEPQKAPADDLLELSAEDELPIPVDPADAEDTAFRVAEAIKPEAPPEPEVVPEVPVVVRRGWRSSIAPIEPAAPVEPIARVEPVAPVEPAPVKSPAPKAFELPRPGPVAEVVAPKAPVTKADEPIAPPAPIEPVAVAPPAPPAPELPKPGPVAEVAAPTPPAPAEPVAEKPEEKSPATMLAAAMKQAVSQRGSKRKGKRGKKSAEPDAPIEEATQPESAAPEAVAPVVESIAEPEPIAEVTPPAEVEAVPPESVVEELALEPEPIGDLEPIAVEPEAAEEPAPAVEAAAPAEAEEEAFTIEPEPIAEEAAPVEDVNPEPADEALELPAIEEAELPAPLELSEEPTPIDFAAAEEEPTESFDPAATAADDAKAAADADAMAMEALMGSDEPAEDLSSVLEAEADLPLAPEVPESTAADEISATSDVTLPEEAPALSLTDLSDSQVNEVVGEPLVEELSLEAGEVDSESFAADEARLAALPELESVAFTADLSPLVETPVEMSEIAPPELVNSADGELDEIGLSGLAALIPQAEPEVSATSNVVAPLEPGEQETLSSSQLGEMESPMEAAPMSEPLTDESALDILTTPQPPNMPVLDSFTAVPPKPAKGRRGKRNADAELENDTLPPPLQAPVRIKPSRGRKGSPAKRGGKTRADAGEDAKTTKASDKSVGKTEILSGPPVEVIESTEPTPESALNLPEIGDAATHEQTPAAPDKMSDSVFGRAVEDLAGSALGELVEPQSRAKSPFEQIVSEASNFVPHDGAPPADVGEEHGEIVADENEMHGSGVGVVLDHADDLTPDDNAPDHLAVSEGEASADTADDSIIAELPGVDVSEEATVGEPLVAFEGPVTSFAGSLAPDQVSAIATETIESLPPMDDLDELTALAPADDFSAGEQAAIDSAPAEVEAVETDIQPVAGDDMLAHAAVESVEADSSLVQAEVESTEENVSVAESDLVSLEETAAQAEADEAPSVSAEAEDESEPSDNVAELQPPVQQAPPPAPPTPFFGMARDTDGFMGGMPLVLPELRPPPPTFGKVSVNFDQPVIRATPESEGPPPLIVSDEDFEMPPSEPPVGPNGPKQQEYQKVPPRPHRPRLADYEKRFADVGEDAALQEMLRSKPTDKPSKESPTASGFDGLAMPTASQVREAEVFSQMPSDDSAFIPEAAKSVDPFFIDKQASIDLAARNIAPGHIPPGSEPNTPADPSAPAPEGGFDPFNSDDIPLAARSTDPFSMMSKLRRSSNSQAPAGVAPDFKYVGSVHDKRKIGIRTLMVAMTICMFIAGVAGFMLTDVSSTLIAKVTYNNLAQRSMFDRVKFQREQENLINSDAVREKARTTLVEQYPKLDAGMLADPLAFERMTRDLKWPEKSNNLVFEVQSVDPTGDKKRLSALLAAINTQNKSLLEIAKQKKAEFDDAQAKLDELNKQQTAVVAAIRQIQNNVGDRPSGAVIADAEAQVSRLSEQYGQAVARVAQLKDEVARLVPPANQPVEMLVPGGDPEQDPIVQQLREEKKSLDAKIAAAKPQGADASDKARKALDDAMAGFQEQLKISQDQLGNASPELKNYVAAAAKLQEMAKQLTTDLIDRQRVQNERLADAKRRFEDQVKARQDQLVNNDPALKDLNDTFAIKRRQANAAASEGMEAEAARYQAEAQDLAAKIEARRKELLQDPESAKLAADIQALIDANTHAVVADQQLIENQMTEVTSSMNTARPSIDKLPADQQAVANTLGDRVNAMLTAREKYLNLMIAMRPEGNTDLRKMEADSQALGTKIEQRLAALTTADKDRKNQSDLEKAALARKIDDTNSALAIAEKAETDARTAWMAKETELNGLRAKVNKDNQDRAAYEDYKRQQQALEMQIKAANKDLDAKTTLGTASITPEPPAADSIVVGDYRDPRWKYALVCAMSVVGFFTFLIFIGGFHRTATPAIHRATVETVGPSKDTDADEPLAV